MRTSELLYGTRLGDCVQAIVVDAARKDTAEGYHDASEQLRGVQRFLTWTNTGDAAAIIALSNHMALLYRAERSKQCLP